MTRMVSVSIDDRGMLAIQDAEYTPPTGILRQVLPVSGGALELDASGPQRGVRAVIDDAAAAAWWVPFVFGADAAEALADLDDLDGPAERLVAAGVPPELDLAEVATRLLLGFWFRRWWPAGVVDAAVEEWLLDAELAALAAEAESLFGGVEIAAALLSRHLERLAAETELALAHGTDDLIAERVTVLERAVLAASDVCDDEVRGFAGVAAAADAVRSRGGLAVPAARVEAEPALASLDGTGAGFSVDWTHLHPRQVSAAADAVQVRLSEEADSAIIDIVVDAPSALVSIPVEPGELYALVGEGPLAEAASLQPEGERFVGSVRVPASGADALPISITSDVYGAITRTQAATGGAVRDDVLRVVRARILSDQAGGVAPFAFEKQLLRDAARRHAQDEVVRLAVDDLELEWLLLSEASFAYRDGASSAAFAATDATAGVRVVVARHPRGWLVRVESLGVAGDVVVHVRFASGDERSVAVTVDEDGLTDAVIDGSSDDTPTDVRVDVTRA